MSDRRASWYERFGAPPPARSTRTDGLIASAESIDARLEINRERLDLAVVEFESALAHLEQSLKR